MSSPNSTPPPTEQLLVGTVQGEEPATWRPSDAPVTPEAPPRPDGARFTRLGLLGRGGMGEVWRVWDPSLRRTLAMKILVDRARQDPVALARFIEEAEATAQLAHPGIVPVHEVGQLEDGRPYFTMREVVGQTLAEVLHEDQPLRRKIELLYRVAETVAYAHSRGVVHRDLKPQNVMIGPFGEVLVLDWGLVKLTPAADIETARSEFPAGQTRFGSIAGTPAYMSPEQASGRSELVSPASDCWALGVLLYEMLVGRPPVVAGSSAEVVRRVALGRLDPLPDTVDPGLSLLCSRALQVDPRLRPDHAGEIAQALRDWLDGVDRQERAVRLVLEADQLEAEVHRLAAGASEARRRADALLRPLLPSAPVALKKAGWALEAEAEALDREAALARVQRMQRLRGALNEDPDLPEAHARLALHYRRAHEQAEAAGDRAAATESLALLMEHVRGGATRSPQAAYLRGEGALTLVPEREGATVRLYRFVEVDRRLVPQLERELPPGPVHELPLPIGSWLACIEAPGHHPVRYPFSLGRLEHWHGRPPGAVAPRPVHQPLLADVPPGACFVPAGWTAIGRRGARLENHVPPSRVWVDDLWVDRHPVTNRDYIAFLDDLVHQGREEEAQSHVPRGVFEAGGANTLVYGRRADGGFEPIPDPEGTLWEPDWPVLMVTWGDAAAYARWRAAKTGLPYRLPHEVEREKAGRGADGRLYPWGDYMDPTWCRVRESEADRRGPVPVSAVPEDESPYGIRGLVGNVADWCGDRFNSEGPAITPDGRLDRSGLLVSAPPGARLNFRGGTWVFHASRCSLDARWSWEATGRRPDLSFRLVSSPQGGPA